MHFTRYRFPKRFLCRFLSVKKWVLRKKHQIELAKPRGWKGYWVCLKGTTLLFYPCDSREGRSVDSAPKHLIIVDGSIMQPIPEHPKRDYIFCLSTAFGDAYLFQAPCQVGVDGCDAFDLCDAGVKGWPFGVSQIKYHSVETENPDALMP